MDVSISSVSPVAHLPLMLGMLRKLEVSSIVDEIIPSHPDNVISTGRGVEALVLSVLDGEHALYRVGDRLRERGMLPLLQPGLSAESVSDNRLGSVLDALFAAGLNRLFGTVALRALEVYGIPVPWVHHDTTTISLYGAYEEEQQLLAGSSPVPPRPAYGHSKDRREDLKQVMLSLSVSSDGGLPLRMGLRDGNASDSKEAPVAVEECLELGLEGLRGVVADSKAYSRRTLGLCLERGVGLVTLVPRSAGIRHELEAWGKEQEDLPLLMEKPERAGDAQPRRWYGRSVTRKVEVDYSDGQVAEEDLRFVVMRSSHLSQTQAQSNTRAQQKEAEVLAEHIRKVESKSYACLEDAQGAIADYEHRGAGRRGRRPRLFRYHELSYRVEPFSQSKRRTGRGRPRAGWEPQQERRYRIRVETVAIEQSQEDAGWTVLATTLSTELCSDAEILEAYHGQASSVEGGLCWIKNPAAIAPVWLDKPERIAALAMITVIGLLVYALLQRQVRLYLEAHNKTLPGNKGATAVPTGAVVLSLFSEVSVIGLKVEESEVVQSHGLKEHHWMICDALGVDRSWYQWS